MYKYKAFCTQVIDGDTVELKIDLGFNINYTIRGRLVGYNAAELFSGTKRELGAVHKAYLEYLILNKEVIVETFKDRQSFGRWLVTIYHNERNINNLMKEYVGG
jgi:micrococcal nuclease